MDEATHSPPSQLAQRPGARPPIAPDTAAEWRNNLSWWEKGAAAPTRINPSLVELSRAQELLAELLKYVPHTEFWRALAPDDRKPALIAVMAQFRTLNPLSRAQEQNRKILPPFEACLEILNDHTTSGVHDLVYLILQNAGHPLNPDQRNQLQTHFEQLARSTNPSLLAIRTAERLNFRVSFGVASSPHIA